MPRSDSSTNFRIHLFLLPLEFSNYDLDKVGKHLRTKGIQWKSFCQECIQTAKTKVTQAVDSTIPNFKDVEKEWQSLELPQIANLTIPNFQDTMKKAGQSTEVVEVDNEPEETSKDIFASNSDKEEEILLDQK